MAGMKMDFVGGVWTVLVFDKGTEIRFTLDEFLKLEPVRYAAPMIVAELAKVDLGTELLEGVTVTSTPH